jgi:hypothetical protein
MRLRRTLSALAVIVGVTAAITLGGEGGATASTTTTSTAAARAVITNASPENGVYVNIGVLRTWEGQGNFYSKGGGVYDGLLPAGAWTLGNPLNWSTTGGFYIGAHYRAETYLWNPATATYQQHAGAPGHPLLNRGWWQVKPGQDWKVAAIPCTC